MAKVLITRKLYFIILAIPIFLGTMITRINAVEFVASNYNLFVNVSENGNATFEVEKVLTNNDNVSVISGYEYILPSSKPKSIEVTLDGAPVDAATYSIDNFNYSKVDINFNSNVIKVGESKTLKIKAIVSDFVKSKDNINFFKILASKDEGASLIIQYPRSFGETTFITQAGSTLKEVGDQYYQLQLAKPDSILVIFGESYTFDIKTKFQLENNKETPLQNLLDLVPDLNDQEVGIKSVLNSEFGLYDKFNNQFGLVKIDKGTRLDVGFEAKVNKKYNLLNAAFSEKYDFGFPEDNGIVQSLLEATKNEPNNYKKLEIANDFLATTFKAGRIIESDYKSNENTAYWSKLLDKNSEFTSFDFSFIMTAFAEHLNLRVQINYGYIVLPDDFGNKADPSFWCLFESEGKTYLMDPYSLALKGFNFFGVESEFDRIAFGIWTPSQTYNNALGLLDINNFVKQIEFMEFDEYNIPTNTIELSSPVVPVVNSGFYHSLDVSVKNNTYKFIKIKDIKFDNNVFTDSTEFNSSLKLALLPGQSNEITIRKIRNYNFLDNGTKAVELELHLDHSEVINASNELSIRYRPTQSILVVVTAITTIVLSLILISVITYRFKIRKKHAY